MMGSAGRTAPAGPVDPADGLVPSWLVNLAEVAWRVLVVVALALVLGYLATVLWTVTASIAVGIVVAAVFAPVVLRLRAKGRSRNAAAGIVWLLALATAAGLLLVLALLLVPYLLEVAGNLRQGVTAVQDQLAAMDVPPVVGAAVSAAVDGAGSMGGDLVGSIVATAASAVTIAILATFLVFFLLRDGDLAWMWLFQAADEAKRERITTAGHVALARVGGYLRGTTILSGLVAASNLVFLAVLGIPLAIPLAILAFLAGYIPYFGGIVVTGITLIVAYGTVGLGPTIVLVVLIGIRNVILSYGVRPAVYGRTVEVHPGVVLLALPAGFALGGVVGLFAAVPIVAVLQAGTRAVLAVVEPQPHPPLPGFVPAWLDRMARIGWRLLVVVALIAVLVFAAGAVPLVVIPLVLGAILAATLEPVVGWLMARGWARGRASALAVGGLFLAVVALIGLALVAMADQAGTIAATALEGAQRADDGTGGQLGIPIAATAEMLRTMVNVTAFLAGSVATFVVTAVLSTLLAFYLLRDRDRLWDRVVPLMRPDAAAPLHQAGGRAAEVLGGYMLGTAAISFVGAASQLVIMVVLGLPLALPVFVLSFILCFIPYIGGFLSTGIALLIALAVGSTADVVIMVIWTVVFNLVQGNIVSPIVYGKTVHLHPAIVLLAIPAGSAVAGILGMFLVVPVLGVVAVSWRTVLGVMSARRQPPAVGRTLTG
jgi:predicted PurR-regulated permease PerM